jgi:Ca2+-transporting ATPase
MANATCIVTDKTGTRRLGSFLLGTLTLVVVTQNRMKAVSFWTGGKQYHADQEESEAGEDQEEANTAEESDGDSQQEERPKPEGGSFDDLKKDLPDKARSLLVANIAVNSSAFEDTDEEGNKDFVGSSTETALLRFLADTEWADFNEEREKAETGQVFPFSSDRKAMATVIKLDDKHIFLIKGAAEILLKICSSEASFSDKDLKTEDLTEDKRKELDDVLNSFADRSLRNLALCYKELDSPPKDDSPGSYDEMAKDLTLLAIAGIMDPLRAQVAHSVHQCHQAGRKLNSNLLQHANSRAVNVIMCTGDSLPTARYVV